jgi:hypothetical protein
MKSKTRLIIGSLLFVLGIGMIASFWPCAFLVGYHSFSGLSYCGIFAFFFGIIPLCIGYGNVRIAIKEIKIYKEDHKKMNKVKKKQFVEIFPYFCDICKKFSSSLNEYCETCESKNTLRIAIKEDYQNFRRD